MSDCIYQYTANEVFKYSDAIFLGQAVEQKKEIVTARFGERKTYWNTKFKVINSWKLINTEYVWVSTGKNFECSKIETGEKYLVYGRNVEHLSDIPISPLQVISETDNSKFNSEVKSLGNKTITLSKGEFYDYTTQVKYLSISFLIFLLIISAVFLWIRKTKDKPFNNYENF